MNSIKLIGTYNSLDNTVTCKRLSENYDIIPVDFGIDGEDGQPLTYIDGRAIFKGRIINNKGQGWVEVDTVEEIPSEENLMDTTECELKGRIKKVYPLRVTRKGRELQDMLIQAGDQFIKVVAFEACPEFIKPGLPVHVKGRLQSRSFRQITTFGIQDRTVYEVALKNLEVLNDKEEN